MDVFINNISPGLLDRLRHETTRETIQEITRAYSDAFFVHPPVPHAEGVRVLEGIRDMGLNIGLISNTGMTPGTAFRRFLDQHKLLHYFDTLTFSDEVKLGQALGPNFSDDGGLAAHDSGTNGTRGGPRDK